MCHIRFQLHQGGCDHSFVNVPQFEAYHCCNIRSQGNSYTILLSYVDDMLIASANKQEIFLR